MSVTNESLDAYGKEPVTLCDAIDRVLDKGAVVKAELTLSVADVDLVYINLSALVASIDTARRMTHEVQSTGRTK